MPPGLKVIADEDAVEADVLRLDGEVEQPAWSELFGRSLVAKPEHVYLKLSAGSTASS